MSLQSIHLRKILKIMYLNGAARISELRKDIRDDLAHEEDGDAGGGDFYGPFWKDAKDHVFGVADLIDQTEVRIERNARRANLYEQLRDGFLVWWNERRRWTNQPFVPSTALKVVVRLPGIDASIKFANLLSVRDGNDEDHFVYPYWFPQPALSDEAARLALWALGSAFPNIDQNELRVLDVIRGQTYSLDRNPLQGNEADIFARRFIEALNDWKRLRLEYD